MNDDDVLRDALRDAVRDVEPADRLAAIRTRTARHPHHTRRSWYAVGGAALAAAAVVVAVAVVTAGDDPGRIRPEVAADPTSESSPARPATATTPVYYVGPGPDGPDGPEAALYRYFEPAGDPLELLMSTPSDPDYRTLWAPGSLRSFEVLADRIVVQVDFTGIEDPLAWDQVTYPLAWDQVTYTLQAFTGSGLPVVLENPSQKVPGPRPRPLLDVMAHLSISDPGERSTYSESFTARGVANGYEGTVACRLLDRRGGVVWHSPTIAGWGGTRLYPWELEVDLRDAAPGEHVLECSTDDPTGGTEGEGAWTDTRTITVE